MGSEGPVLGLGCEILTMDDPLGSSEVRTLPPIESSRFLENVLSSKTKLVDSSKHRKSQTASRQNLSQPGVVLIVFFVGEASQVQVAVHRGGCVDAVRHDAVQSAVDQTVHGVFFGGVFGGVFFEASRLTKNRLPRGLGGTKARTTKFLQLAP